MHQLLSKQQMQMTTIRRIKNLLFANLTLLLFTTFTADAVDTPKYFNSSQSIQVRVKDLLSRLTLEEKISFTHAGSKFTTPAIPRPAILRRWFSDGPHGLREDIGADTRMPARTDDFSKAMPAAVTTLC
jgi:beta-glucosidase